MDHTFMPFLKEIKRGRLLGHLPPMLERMSLSIFFIYQFSKINFLIEFSADSAPVLL